jgi:glucokinase
VTDRGDVIGCDIGGTAVKLVRLRGSQVVAALEVPAPREARGTRVVAELVEAVRSLAPEGSGRRIQAVGVALPGFLDRTRSEVIYLSHLPRLNGMPLRKELERRLELPVFLDTDTNAGAVAEAALGAGRSFERVLYLTLGTGLGAALVVDGQPVRVSRHTVGQVAHIPLAERGPRCSCGGRGCAESLLSGGGILLRARRAGLRGLKDTEALWQKARRRTRDGGAARRVWREVGASIGRLVSLLAALFSPDAVILGGGTAGAAEFFLPAAASVVRRRWPRSLGRPPLLRTAAMGRLAGAAGAGLLARRACAASAQTGESGRRSGSGRRLAAGGWSPKEC